jgi:hypothetical protein
MRALRWLRGECPLSAPGAEGFPEHSAGLERGEFPSCVTGEFSRQLTGRGFNKGNVAKIRRLFGGKTPLESIEAWNGSDGVFDDYVGEIEDE